MIYTFNIRDYNKKKPFFPYEYKDYSFKVDLNIERVKSEWKLHNAMYGYGLATDSTRRVDIYLNASDDKYGWFFDFYYFFFG